MKKLAAVLCILLTSCALIFAQTENENPNNTPEINTDENYQFKMNQSGDWFLKLNINAGVPILPQQLKFGMDLNFGAYYFLTTWFAVGGNISFNYNPTLGQKVFYSIPILAEAVFQLELGRFEIPLFLGIGGSFEHHSSNFLFGLIMKPELGVYYRINTEWSVGASFAASILPQWYSNPEYNYWGYILNPGISARYHL
ncbi:MAG: hypothetical protein K5839_04685 [Treponemataceae bacterium]|nr:hypothetical protein [Treponemataceae bacterium]